MQLSMLYARNFFSITVPLWNENYIHSENIVDLAQSNSLNSTIEFRKTEFWAGLCLKLPLQLLTSHLIFLGLHSLLYKIGSSSN